MSAAVGNSLLKKHNDALDGLRFWAFMAVYLFHAGCFAAGNHGVTVFFVLSGFLIGRILLLQKQDAGPLGAKLRIFYIRRALRIFPLYYLALAVIYSISFCLRDDNTLRAIPYNAVYLSNFYFFATGVNCLTTHFWTLAIEEQFYLIAPLLLFACAPRKIAWFSSLYILANILLRLAISKTAYQPRYYMLSHYEFCFLGLGTLIAFVDLHRPTYFDRHALTGKTTLFLLALLAALCAVFYRYTLVVHLTIACASAWLILGLWRNVLPGVSACLAWPPFAYLGRISYGLYVYHLPILILCQLFLRGRGVQNSVGFCVTVGVSMLSWHLFERPLNNLKRHFSYAASPPPRTAPPA